MPEGNLSHKMIKSLQSKTFFTASKLLCKIKIVGISI